MPVTVVVGGQKGDEGKGKIAAFLALKENFDIVVRISGPNAGHTLEIDNKVYPLATLPCGFINKNSRILVGRGAFIDKARILDEIERTGLNKSNRIGVDAKAVVITEDLKLMEQKNKHLMNSIGSVGTGLGPARIKKISRDPDITFAEEIDELKPFVTDTTAEIHEALQKDKKILLEGDQGFGLSLIHGEYPFVTSRDTTASTFLGEAGIGPTAVRDVYIVFKPYVTRVATGPLENEVNDVSDWFHTKGREVGTVSGRKRRVGGFEWENAIRAVRVNGATKIALTHIDYFGEVKSGKLSEKACAFIEEMKEKICSLYPNPEVKLVSYGPGHDEVLEF